MKKILLLASILMFTGCAVGQTEQKPLYKEVAVVSDIISDWAVLDTSGNINYRVPASDLEPEKEYVFWLEITDCGNCRTRQAVIVKKSLTWQQIQRDQEQIARELSNRKIIK